jgi:hypothetical protein
MNRLTCAAAIIFLLSTAGAAFAQSPTRSAQTGDSCMAMDYNCNTRPKGIGIDNTETTKSVDPNVARLRNELRKPPPIASNEPEEPEQPIEPEGPISNTR